jgi:uncharacterized protein (TIGR02246 family)
MERDLVNDVEKVYQVWKDYGAALREGDIKHWLSLWTQNGVQLLPGEPYRKGLNQIRSSLQRNFELFVYEKFTAYPEEVQIMGDRAYTHGVYSACLKPVDQGNRVRICGKFLTILKKQVDGSWKIAVDCSNVNPAEG